jgi:hypothetical protein
VLGRTFAHTPRGRALEDDALTADALDGPRPKPRETPETATRGSGVGALTVIAFITFSIVYAIFGGRTAGITFWSVFFGLPALMYAGSGLAGVRTRHRREELLEVAQFAVQLAEAQRSERATTRAAATPPPSPERSQPTDV